MGHINLITDVKCTAPLLIKTQLPAISSQQTHQNIYIETKSTALLELRPTCENCNVSLTNDSDQAMICTYECTFCKTCVETILNNVCPNCGGGFTARPTRPKAQLDKHPLSQVIVHKPVDMAAFIRLRQAKERIDPRNR